jgi:hypothetical protein
VLRSFSVQNTIKYLEIFLTNVGEHYLKVELFHIQFCNDAEFW